LPIPDKSWPEPNRLTRRRTPCGVLAAAGVPQMSNPVSQTSPVFLWAGAALAAGGAVAGLGLLGELAQAPMLIAPFGASAILVFALPAAPLAQPRAVVFGNLMGAAIGLAVHAALGSAPLAIGLAVGLTLLAMLTTRTLHAPAGGMPVLIAASAPDPLVFLPTVVAATSALVLAGALYHRFVSRERYPLAWW